MDTEAVKLYATWEGNMDEDSYRGIIVNLVAGKYIWFSRVVHSIEEAKSLSRAKLLEMTQQDK